ncbi:MAG: FtsX-like permease family protein [Myxococcota bacterium]|nr:FtsX-like permease family protein [Myxococcota bacterium]
MEFVTRLWGGMEALAGSLSVGFILLIGLILVVFAGVYLVAAFVVLTRFARSAQSLWVIAICALLICPLYAVLWLRVTQPELASGAAWSSAFWGLTVWLYLACLVTLPLGRMALRRGRRGIAFGVVLAAGLGLLISFFLGRLHEGSILQSVVYGWVGLVVLVLLPLCAAGLFEIRRGPEWFIATRYLVAERRQVFISAITLICVGAVAAGVWLIIIVLSVMNGFERTWRDEIVGNYAHFLVRSYFGEIVDYPPLLGEIEKLDGVVAASPYIEAEGMIRGAGGVIAPVSLRGIDPQRAPQVTRFAEKVTAGRIDDLMPDPDRDVPGLLIGSRLAEKLGLATGDEMVVISPEGGPATALGPSPRLLRFAVLGTFESSFLQFDELFAYGHLSAVQEFLGVGDVIAGFEVRTHDFYRSGQVADAVAEALGHPFYSRDWKELFPGFFHALNDNRSLMFMLLVMIMVVSAFVIVVTLMMMIMAKSTDVAILKTMGADDRSIELIFAIEGTLIGVVGVALGVLAGIAVSTRLAWVQNRIEEVTGVDTLPASVYQVSTLPTEVDPTQLIAVVSIALVLSLGATLLPSRHGSRLDPVEALREE